MNWRASILVDGERFNAIKRNGLSIAIDDYRDDSHYIDPMQAQLMEDADTASHADVITLAKRAIESIPDVSCEAIAEAFGLNRFSVMSISRKRNKAKRNGVNKNTEYSWYSRDEIMSAIQTNYMGDIL